MHTIKSGKKALFTIRSVRMTKKQVWNRKEDLLNEADRLVLDADMLAFESRYEEAVISYEKALKIVPGNADVWAFKAITLEGGLGHHDEALKCWDAAKRLDHEIADAIDMTTNREEEPGFDGLDLTVQDSCRDKILKLMMKKAENQK
jgi:tetratricopeptide (TPR) repeat protein